MIISVASPQGATDVMVPTQDLAEVSPGVWQGALPPGARVRYAFYRLVPVPGQPDLLRQHLITDDEWISVDEAIRRCARGRMGRNTLFDLMYGGFVAFRFPTPRKAEVNYSSLLEHLQACADPSFWTPERCNRFKTQPFKPDPRHRS